MSTIRKLRSDSGFAARVALCHLLGRRYPLSVTFISTYRCNFTCDYCDVYKYKVPEMTTIDALSMMDQFKALGTRRFSFNGGEPLLRPDIGELIGYAKRKGFFTTMFSNGSLVAKNIDKLKKLDILTISLDGPRDVHEGQRMAGSFDRVIEGIKAAKAAGLNVWTNTVITRENIERLDETVELATGLGARMIFQPVLNYSHSSSGDEIGALASDDTAYRRAIDHLIGLKNSGSPIVHSDEYLNYIKYPIWEVNKRKCWAAELYCAVTPTGEVAPCYPIFNSKHWPSGRKLGYRKAFEEAGSKKISCDGCYCALVESDFLYSLRMKTVFNLMKSVEIR